MHVKGTFSLNDKLGDIVVKFPQASEIFKQYGIDFCCGGEQALSNASQEHLVNGSTLLGELNTGYDEARRVGVEITDWMAVPLEPLIHHIVNTHHAYLQKVFPPLTELTTKLLRVHGKNHGIVLSQVHRLFSGLRMNMEEHMIKEEEIVFPQIVLYQNDRSLDKLEAVISAVTELDREHDSAGDTLKEIRKATDNFSLPDDACGTYIYVFQKLEELESNVFQHIHLENNVLFARLLNDRGAFL